MRGRVLTVALVALLGVWAGLALAQDEAKPQKAAVGKIVEVSEDFSDFTLQMGEAEESHKLVLNVTAATTFEVDGETAAAAEALVVGAHAKVRYAGDSAASVAVTTEKKGEPAADKDEAEDEEMEEE